MSDIKAKIKTKNTGLPNLLTDIAERAREASRRLAKAGADARNKSLLGMSSGLVENTPFILEENAADLKNARSRGLSRAMTDRLTLDKGRIEKIASGLAEVAALPDPVGEIIKMWRRPNGLEVGRMRIPLGVIGIIYESRPNVTADAAGLCVKSGNAVILRGGSESVRTNVAIGEVLRHSLKGAGLPEDSVQVIPVTDREAVLEMIGLDEYIDLVIPRGGEGLIRFVAENSRIPVLKHYKGVCHVFVDESAEAEMAEKICLNAKMSRPGVCNAMETLLVHEKIAPSFLPGMIDRFTKGGVEIRGCPSTMEIAPGVKEATEDDWYEEYLGPVLSVRVVGGLDEAVSHIEKYGSMHTESIVTSDYSNARAFVNGVNSSTVLVNASTRFADGYELGLGAEIGISTSKLHAFGPMGLEELTTTKFIVFGEGQVRE